MRRLGRWFTMWRVRRLVILGRYERAEELLLHCHHPKAREWLALVQSMQGPVRHQPEEENP
jgi:hypothetical protein